MAKKEKPISLKQVKKSVKAAEKAGVKLVKVKIK